MSAARLIRTSVEAAPKQIWLLCLGALVNRVGSFVQLFLVIYLREQRGFSAAVAGAAVTLYGSGSLAAAGAGGVLTDRIGSRQTIVVSMLLTAADLAAIPSVGAPLALLPLLALAGFATDLYRPAAAALLAEHTSPANRLPVFGLYRTLIGVGYTLGAALGGFIASIGYKLVFLADATSSLLFAIVAGGALITDSQPRRGVTCQIRPSARQPLGELGRLLLAAALVSLVYFQSRAAIPLHLRASGQSLVTFGALMALQGLTSTLFALPAMIAIRRLPAQRLLAASALLIGFGIATTGLAHATWTLAITIVLWTVGEAFWTPLSQARTADLAPPGHEGRYQGATGVAWSTGFAAGPMLGTIVYTWNQDLLWLLCAVTALLAASALHEARRSHHYSEPSSN